jgi:TonB family protein
LYLDAAGKLSIATPATEVPAPAPTRTAIGKPRGTVLLAQQTLDAKPADSPGASSQSLTGAIADPSNATVPNASVTLTNTDTDVSVSTTTDNTGMYRFQNIEPGNYKVTLRVPGFKGETQTGIVVAAGEAHNGGKMLLQLGSISESVSVTGSRSAAASAALPTIGNPLGPVTTLGPMTTLAPAGASPASAPRSPVGHANPSIPGGPIRVGGMVQAARLINAVRPVYPLDPLQRGVEGTVKIEAVLSRDGVLLSPRVINSPDPGLTQPALDAIKLWRYEPTLLNGEPVEVMTTIDVNFSLTN